MDSPATNDRTPSDVSDPPDNLINLGFISLLETLPDNTSIVELSSRIKELESLGVQHHANPEMPSTPLSSCAPSVADSEVFGTLKNHPAHSVSLFRKFSMPDGDCLSGNERTEDNKKVVGDTNQSRCISEDDFTLVPKPGLFTNGFDSDGVPAGANNIEEGVTHQVSESVPRSQMMREHARDANGK